MRITGNTRRMLRKKLKIYLGFPPFDSRDSRLNGDKKFAYRIAKYVCDRYGKCTLEDLCIDVGIDLTRPVVNALRED